MPEDVVMIVPSLELIVLSPLAVVVLLLVDPLPLPLPLPEFVVLVLGDEVPHAARPTTAAAARMGAANHRLRIVSSPFVTVTRSAYIQEHVRPHRIVQEQFRLVSGRSFQAAIRWQSQASDIG
jgi:hypothetical protein